MKRTYFLLFYSILFTTTFAAQSFVRIYGSVSDKESGELLPSASLYIPEKLQGTSTNQYGFYALNVSRGDSIKVQVSYAGYESKTIHLVAYMDTLLNIQLNSGVQLKEYTVLASERSIANPYHVGQLRLSPKEIKGTPVIAGESNLMMTLKTLPGVSSGKEGSSELYVRGGSHDQNLILLDNAPVYNLNHAFGLLSVFNSAAIKNVNLYKGGIPANYGGRLSSVLDVSVKEGNRQERQGEFSMSTIAATLTAEAPIVKDKASFLVSARRSWPDMLVTGISSEMQSEMIPGYYFFDVNAKTNFTLKEKHNFYVSYYNGKDKLFVKSNVNEQKGEINQSWENTIVSARYQSASSKGAFNDAQVYYSAFQESDLFTLQNGSGNLLQQNQSRLDEYGFQANRRWGYQKALQFHTGLSGVWRKITPPFKITEEGDIQNTYYSAKTEFQKELAMYGIGTYSSNKIDLSLGVRAIGFGQELTHHISLEPRLSFAYKYSKSLTIKGGAMRNSQSVFALQKSTMGLMGYTWLPATNYLTPQYAWQVSMGTNWTRGHWSVDIEGYYKWLRNIVGNYLYPSTLYTSANWHEILEQGNGKAYGLDFLAQYSTQRLQCSLKYSLANAPHSFPSILQGDWIPANYNIKHDLALAGEWTIRHSQQKRKWLTGVFTVHSGIPVSLPTQSVKSMLPILENEQYYFDYSFVDYYTHPNNARLSTYHRLDLGYHTQKQKTKGNRTWSLGILNVYNQQNPYAIYKDNTGAFKKLVLFPIMPYVSFKRSF